MLFNSIEYLFVFLPLAVAGFHLARFMSGAQAAIGVLIIASLVFYGSWKPIYLILLVASICTNFVVGQSVLRLGDRQLRWLIAAAGITVNLLLLGYFKYSSFVVTNLAAAFGTGWVIERIILPLGISFFTFQQIAYLVDCYKRDVARHGFLEYALLVTLFPHLIAGPITQPRHVLEQFASKDFGRVSFDLMVQGIILFSIGLAKKVLLADNLALYATPVFDSAAAGNGIRFFEGWIGALAFTFQLYFDFSGYSDMALGAALFFGIYLPVNFHSPYKATSIIEFWRRWHHPVGIPAALSVYSARRQPGGRSPALPQSDHRHAAGRHLAWRGLDLCDLGPVPWPAARGQPWVPGAGGARFLGAGRPCLDATLLGYHIPFRRHRLGAVPCGIG